MADTQAVKKEKKEPKPKVARFVNEEGTVADFISAGFSEIEEIGSEFREIYDNAPESLQNSDVNQTRESTASEIEGFSEPSCDSTVLGELSCSCQIDMGKMYRGRQSQSRACRASNGANKLRAAAAAVQEWLDSHDELPEADTNDAASMKERAEKLEELEAEGIDASDYEQAREEAEQLISDCEEIADNVDGLEYPGMFG